MYESKKILEDAHPDIVATTAYPLKDGYVFSYKYKKELHHSGFLLDPFYKVSSTGEITEWAPNMDLPAWHDAVKQYVEFK